MSDACADAAVLLGVLVLDQVDTVDEDLAVPALEAVTAMAGARRAAVALEVLALAAAYEAERLPQGRVWLELLRSAYTADPAVVGAAVDIAAQVPPDGGRPPAVGAVAAAWEDPGDPAVAVWVLFCVASAVLSALASGIGAQLGDPVGHGDDDPIRPVNIAVSRVAGRVAGWVR